MYRLAIKESLDKKFKRLQKKDKDLLQSISNTMTMFIKRRISPPKVFSALSLMLVFLREP